MDCLTRNDVARIHRIFIFDEAESIHKFDLGDLSGAMGIEVSFDIGFGCCVPIDGLAGRFVDCRIAIELTITREIPQVKSGGGDLGHVDEVLKDDNKI